MEWNMIILGVLAGLVAGVINTISGSGSIITLSLMGFFNIPMDIANGTNRIGILAQGIKGSHAFHQRKQLQIKDSWTLIILCLLGALGGIFTAIKIDPKQFNFILGCIFLGLLFIIIFEPQKKLTHHLKIQRIVPWLMLPIGFYGGFIQVATGVFLLSILHTFTGKSLKETNPLKVFIITLFNIPAVIVFTWSDKINWPLGIALAVGQYMGAIIGVKINSTSKLIEPFLRFLLIVLVILAILKFWDFL